MRGEEAQGCLVTWSSSLTAGMWESWGLNPERLGLESVLLSFKTGYDLEFKRT